MAMDADQDTVLLEVFNDKPEIHYNCRFCLFQCGFTERYHIPGRVMQRLRTEDEEGPR